MIVPTEIIFFFFYLLMFVVYIELFYILYKLFLLFYVIINIVIPNHKKYINIRHNHSHTFQA